MTARTLVYTCSICGEYSAYAMGSKSQTCSNCKVHTASYKCRTTQAVHSFGDFWMINGGDGVVTVTFLPGVKLPNKHQLHEDMADASSYMIDQEEHQELKHKFLKTAEERGIKNMFTPANEVPVQPINIETLTKEQYDMLLSKGILKALMNETRTYEEYYGIKVQLTAEQTMDKLSQAFMEFSIRLLQSQCAPGSEECEKRCKLFIESQVAAILNDYGFELALNSNK